jgi:pimeloyl-ACP methyl ester carboxylesterase
MEPSSWSLSTGDSVTGLKSIPTNSRTLLQYKPLIVGLHGGGYKSGYFDADPKHTASIASEAFGVPFVAVDRPGLGGTSSILPIPLDSNYPDECAKQLHHHILPKAWAEVGIPNNCNSIVILGHSLGTAVSVATAALHAREEEAPYPLGGLIVSGLGHQLQELASSKNNALPPQDTMEFTIPPIEDKNRLMFSSRDTADPAAIEASERMNVAFPLAEIVSLNNVWIPHWRERWAPHIVVPVYFAFPERELAFKGTQEHVDECLQAFTKSRRVEGSLIPGAPHCMELSHWSSSWYARCFGFAMECASTFERAPLDHF